MDEHHNLINDHRKIGPGCDGMSHLKAIPPIVGPYENLTAEQLTARMQKRLDGAYIERIDELERENRELRDKIAKFIHGERGQTHD